MSRNNNNVTTITSDNENNNPKKNGRKLTIIYDEDDDTLCGIGSWKPQWIQRFASAQFFVINFSIVAILQGALFTYMIGIMSTIEKRFAFETKVSGFILIADNLSQMFISPVVGYLGSKYNRSRLIAVGELVVAVSCLMNAVPYLMYGPGLHLLNKQVDEAHNSTRFDLCYDKLDENCDLEDGHSSSSLLSIPVIILWLSSFANGLGYTAFYTIGLPYVDDNISKKNSAMYLSAISTIRLLGPTLGFILSSACLKLYENPFMDPGIHNRDPRWIGAWWLGFVILGFAIFIFTIPMLMFPKKFKDFKEKEVQESIIKISKIKDAWHAIKRLSTNYLLIFHVAGGVFRVIGYLGYYIIKPKYMELQYRQSASSASFFTGAASVVTMAIGTICGGIYVHYMRPGARYIAIFICLVEIFAVTGIFSAAFLNCPTPTYSGLDLINPSVNMDLSGSCNLGCDCSTKVFQPLCAADGKTNYFSPCFAGCQSFSSSNGLTFQNCSCIGSGNIGGGGGGPEIAAAAAAAGTNWATDGLCGSDCNLFPYFIVVLSVSSMVASTARTGDTLLTLRSVDPADKSFAMGVMGSIFAIFAFIPYPLIFGAIIDSTCLVWEKTCGKSGNCWLYDIDKFRKYFHTGALVFIAIGILLEIGTVINAGQIKNLYDDEDEDVETNPKPLKEADAKLPQVTNGEVDQEQQQINRQDINGDLES